MNNILYFKLKREFRNKTENELKEILKEMQRKFNINEKSNVFDIEENISDSQYAEFIKKYEK